MDDEGCILYDENGTPTINPESDYKEDGFTHVDELWDGTTMQPCTNVYLDLNYSVVKDMGEYDLYNMYVNRDPRFYASLTFQGAKFRNATEVYSVVIILLIGEIKNNMVHFGLMDILILIQIMKQDMAYENI